MSRQAGRQSEATTALWIARAGGIPLSLRLMKSGVALRLPPRPRTLSHPRNAHPVHGEPPVPFDLLTGHEPSWFGVQALACSQRVETLGCLRTA
jgi:hypothetical protein